MMERNIGKENVRFLYYLAKAKLITTHPLISVKQLGKVIKVKNCKSQISYLTFRMKIGYIRVSTYDQNIDLQKDALEKVGCEKIFIDKVSGVTNDREALSKIKEIIRAKDTFVVWRLDRLGRSLKDLINWMNYFEDNQIQFQSITEALNTSTSVGKLVFHMFGALAEFERNLISERTLAGLQAAKSRGRTGGRPKRLDAKKRKHIYDLYKENDHTIKEICELMGITKPTLYSYVKEFDTAPTNKTN
jgi:DNA invertase Pin-like site-specific DNA recombinase